MICCGKEMREVDVSDHFGEKAVIICRECGRYKYVVKGKLEYKEACELFNIDLED